MTQEVRVTLTLEVCITRQAEDIRQIVENAFQNLEYTELVRIDQIEEEAELYEVKDNQYHVRLLAVNTANPDQQMNGYLANFGMVASYDKKEAKKKANMFGGIIEKAI